MALRSLLESDDWHRTRDCSTDTTATVDASYPQQPLIAWAEFTAEDSVKHRTRGRRFQSATASLFDWGLALEQEREKEAVGV